MITKEKLHIVCFGEVLWDVFPNHKTIGGAPLNVSSRIKSFGASVDLISRIGNDLNGKGILEYLEENDLQTQNIQLDKQFETGSVNVVLDEKGSASYEVKYPVAWDKIMSTTKAINSVKNSDAFIFGSLACRDSVSKNTLLHLLQYAKFKVFDVNLRPPHYSFELLLELMTKSDFIKLNDDELLEICNHLGKNSSNINEMIKYIAKRTKTRRICVTLGEDGATLFIDNGFYKNKGYQVKVQDTVGAGDSFLATLIIELLSENQPQVALNMACSIGAIVASKRGANPKIDKKEIIEFMNKISK